jgi:import inner membrane translocase subunit TIM17
MGEREPCPFRIVEDTGGGFMLGAILGSGWYTFKGARNSPAGQRFRGGIYNAKMRAPVLAGGFAIWGLLFSSYDCTFEHLRRKEDPWNSILAGAATGGTLAARAGPRVAASQAFFGGVILAAIEGVSILAQEYLAPPPEPIGGDMSTAEQDEMKLAPPSF